MRDFRVLFFFLRWGKIEFWFYVLSFCCQNYFSLVKHNLNFTPGPISFWAIAMSKFHWLHIMFWSEKYIHIKIELFGIMIRALYNIIFAFMVWFFFIIEFLISINNWRLLASKTKLFINFKLNEINQGFNLVYNWINIF